MAFAAWSRRIELGPGLDPQADRAYAWTQAWIDRHGVAPGAGARVRRQVRRARAEQPAVPVAVEVSAARCPVTPVFLAPRLPQDADVDDQDLTADGLDLVGEPQDGPAAGEDRPDVSDLLDPGREVAAELRRDGTPLTRAALTTGLRTRGFALSTDRASALLAVLHLDQLDTRHDDATEAIR